jgi:hypothetical protein
MRDLRDRLKEGDVVIRHTLLFEPKEIEILRVEGNKAIAKWYTFNATVWHGKVVYEYGKRTNQWSPVYLLKPAAQPRQD